MLPENNDGDVVVVTINGERTEVPIGVETEVERNVAEVLAANRGFSLPDVEEPEEEAAEPESVEVPLLKQSRAELNQTAENLGVESPEDLDNRREVMEAIEDVLAEEEEEEASEEASEGGEE